MSSDPAPQTGTTIVACVYNGGVVLGADGRVSVGQYISNRASNKIAPLTDTAFLLRSGSAADTQAISDYGARTGFKQRSLLRPSLWFRQHFVAAKADLRYV
jgi:20S proteasome alpha/beta subunit